ncbi:MAG: hypothetical protein ACTJFI_09730, partial [Enterococcus viikkiensis]
SPNAKRAPHSSLSNMIGYFKYSTRKLFVVSNAQFETNGTIDKVQLKTFIPDIHLEKIAAVSSKS